MDSPDRLSKKGCDRNYLYLRVYFVCRQGHCVGYYYFFDIRLLRQSRRCIAGQHSVVVVEHDMDFVRSIASRVTVLHEGRVIAEGDMDTVQNHPQVIEVYLGA